MFYGNKFSNREKERERARKIQRKRHLDILSNYGEFSCVSAAAKRFALYFTRLAKKHSYRMKSSQCKKKSACSATATKFRNETREQGVGFPTESEEGFPSRYSPVLFTRGSPGRGAWAEWAEKEVPTLLPRTKFEAHPMNRGYRNEVTLN